VRHYLVVANRTLVGEHLLDAVRQRLTEGPCHFHVVVPASHSSGTFTEGEARAQARERLEQGLARFRDIGAEVDGEVGDAAPVVAIGDALQAHPYDEIILSTLPPGPSRWLKQDLPHRIQRTYTVPLTHLVAEGESVT
jgi:hypothetical protein